jgi:hypothetical protein
MKTYRSLFSLIVIHSLLVATSDAAIIYSGLQNISISTSFEGTYLDVDAGLVVPLEGDGWDINPLYGGEGIGNSPSFQPVRAPTSISSAVKNLAFGQMVTSSSIYASGFAGSDSHMACGQISSFRVTMDHIMVGCVSIYLTRKPADLFVIAPMMTQVHPSVSAQCRRLLPFLS